MKQLNWYQIFGNTHIIPDGRTVTPTDDIQTLLHCANIWDKDYTTLAEVLADDDTLFLICISNNAIDYLVRSTTWASINGLVPTMTSNTTPSGIVSSNSVRTNSNYPWNAFNGIDNGGGWCPTNAGNNLYIQYKFESATLINSVTVKSMNAAQQSAVWSLKASNDGVTFVELTTVNEPDPNDKVTKSFGNTTEYQYYRLEGYFTNSGGGVKVQLYSPSVVMSESAMQYIGASDYASETLLSDSTWAEAIAGSSYSSYVANAYVPTMTDNTHPSGEASASSVYSSSYPAYKAFDGNDSSTWAAVTTSAEQYLQYDFGKKIKTYMVGIKPLFSGGNLRLKTFSVKASDDGLTFETLKTLTTIPNQDSGMVVYALENAATADMHSKIRLDNMTTYQNEVQIFTVQFYGREIGGVQTWLKAGGITNKKYTTVSEVLSDLTTLATLMSSSDAIDYLVTAKGWATEICSDSNAMADIGMNNYAANTLLADETWCNAIANSAYIESVLNVKVPAMTDNTHPYGEVTASSVYNPRSAWYAFDMDNTTWWAGASPTNSWIGYSFPSAVKIVAVKAKPATGQNADQFPKNVKVQYSTDGNTYSDAKSSVFAMGVENTLAFNNTSIMQHWRLFCTDNYGAGLTTSIGTLQFYGRKDI